MRYLVLAFALAAAAITPTLANYYATKADARQGRMTAEPGTTKTGFDDCTNPTSLADPQGGSVEDSGNTNFAANTVNAIPVACNGIWSQVRGADHIYTFDVGPGNALTFELSTSSRDYDPSIYVLSVCGDGATCVTGAAADNCTASRFGQTSPCPGTDSTETFSVSGLVPGTYFFYVDSFYSPNVNPTAAQGPYTLTVSGDLPVELIEFSVE